MQDLESRVRVLGCPKLNLQIRAENGAVRAFYERLGYCVEERLSMGKVLCE
jgi:ribosomal protein S18 acetylase RimI-like enzyme